MRGGKYAIGKLITGATLCTVLVVNMLVFPSIMARSPEDSEMESVSSKEIPEAKAEETTNDVTEVEVDSTEDGEEESVVEKKTGKLAEDRDANVEVEVEEASDIEVAENSIKAKMWDDWHEEGLTLGEESDGEMEENHISKEEAVETAYGWLMEGSLGSNYGSNENKKLYLVQYLKGTAPVNQPMWIVTFQVLNGVTKDEESYVSVEENPYSFYTFTVNALTCELLHYFESSFDSSKDYEKITETILDEAIFGMS